MDSKFSLPVQNPSGPPSHGVSDVSSYELLSQGVDLLGALVKGPVLISGWQLTFFPGN